MVDGAARPLLALIQASAAGHPASADVHGAEGVEVLAFGAVPAMGHQAYFQEGGSVFIPFGESAKGDGGLEQGAGIGCGEGSPALWLPVGTEQPVYGGVAHGAHLLLYLLLQEQLRMAFQNFYQFGDEGAWRRPGCPASTIIMGPAIATPTVSTIPNVQAVTSPKTP